MKAAAKATPAPAPSEEAGLFALSQRLRKKLPRIRSGYEPGRLALVRALAELTGESPRGASQTLKKLIELGAVKYTTSGRGIGAAGIWTYPRAQSTRPRPPVRPRRAA